jgi:serine protease inhibitor
MIRYVNPKGKKKVLIANQAKSLGVYPAFENQADFLGL